MEIKSLYTVKDHNDGAEMRVIDPNTGKETEFFIKLAGVDSDMFRNAESKGKRNALKIASDSDLSDDQKAEKQRQNFATVIAESTIGWRGLKDNGKELKFSTKKAKELYINAPQILEQADRFIAKRANFIKG